ncbi:hypothetical protein C8R43DRAFT_1208680 [Mycena crocata]|nr:hypothetical protein C8R43DRAFT_1208680 [Mycena crocata]
MPDVVLPIELEREVFELAALLHPDSMPVLLLVAQRVRIWIEPLMHQVLSIHPVLQKYLYRRSLKEISNMIRAKPASFFHERVRHICFARTSDPQDIANILAVCTGTVNIAFFNAELGDSLLSVLATLPLQRLSAVLGDLFYPSAPGLQHSLFANITHLDILDWHDGGWNKWDGLAGLPRLTHLSFNDDISNSVCQGALDECMTLKVLVIVWSSREVLETDPYDRAELAMDPRFAMIVVSKYLEDWEMGARGGEDFWSRTDDFVRNRRAGVVKEHFIGVF